MDEGRLRKAQDLLRAGRVAEAFADLRRLTAEEPRMGAAWYLRSLAEQDLRPPREALASVERALELEPGQPYYHLQAGRLLQRSGELVRAAEEFGRAARAKPDWATAWTELGAALASLDRGDEARSAFESALGADPRYAAAHFQLARLLQNAGDVERALVHARQATALDSRHVNAHLLLGDLLRKRQDDAGALACYRAAAAVAPQNPRGGLAVAELLWESGAIAEATREYDAVSRHHPGSLKAALGARLLLPQVYESVAHLEACRDRYRAGLLELLDDPARFSRGRADDILQEIRWVNFYLAYQGRDDRELQSLYGDLVRRVLEPAVPRLLEPRPRRARGSSRIRVGFLSHFFYDCTVGRYFSAWVRGLDPARFETVVYHTNPRVSADTEAIRAAAARFRHVPGRPVGWLAEQVLADELDVLVYPELGMQPDTFALASLRLAPVQCAGWGHPTTTGLPSIDWFLTCGAMEPEGAQSQYRERLQPLPGLGTRYERPSGAEAASRAELGLPEGRRLYLVPQSVFKIHPDNDALIADVLAADPGSAAVMFAAGPRGPIDAFVRRLKPVLASRGLATGRDLVFLPSLTHGAYLAVNRACDAMLDTLHWSGGNTSLDAIAMGLPVVTLPGRLMRGRQSEAMLRMLGLAELVATDEAHYVRLAGEVARDRGRREAISAAMHERSGQLFGQDAPVAAFARFLEEVAGP